MQPVIIDGQATGEYKFEANPALKGYELLGKHLKLFSDKLEIDATIVSLSDKLADMDDPE